MSWRNMRNSRLTGVRPVGSNGGLRARSFFLKLTEKGSCIGCGNLVLWYLVGWGFPLSPLSLRALAHHFPGDTGISALSSKGFNWAHSAEKCGERRFVPVIKNKVLPMAMCDETIGGKTLLHGRGPVG